MARDDVAGAVGRAPAVLEENPDFEMSYVTLAKIYLSTGRRARPCRCSSGCCSGTRKNPLALQMIASS